MRLIRALRDCKQRSLTVSKKAPTASKKLSPFRKYLIYVPFSCLSSVAALACREVPSPSFAFAAWPQLRMPALMETTNTLLGASYSVTLRHPREYGEKKTDKEKSHKGILWAECPGSVPGINSGRPRDTRYDPCG